jgi:hypothetical protein
LKAIICTTLLISGLSAESATFSSNIEKTSLIELYTSESYSSGPPAEKRMNIFMKPIQATGGWLQ